jgi:phage terminase small subunit
MTILSNSRHEAFARAVLQGKNGREAYIAAGYNAAGAEANASRLIRNDKVSARIAELKGKAAEGAVATARQVLEELTRIGLANMRDYVGSHGQLADVSQLTREQTAAIQEITVGPARQWLSSFSRYGRAGRRAPDWPSSRRA